LKITITGQGGFIGSHLKNNLEFIQNEFSVNEFNSEIINNQFELDKLVSNSDIIVHLAGINRSSDPEEVFNINYNISKLIKDSIERVNFSGKLIFASSIQEDYGNQYGNAKKESRELFIESSNRCKYDFCGLIIPNVFGPFCKPNYNSFISTFSHNLIHGIKTSIDKKSKVDLIYIDNLIDVIISEFRTKSNPKKIIKSDISTYVNEVYDELNMFYNNYVLDGIIPELNTEFSVNLFNTFRSFLYNNDFFPVYYPVNEDERGRFSELIRSNSKGQFSFSTTNKKFVRGNHFHTKKIERFSVIQGKAQIELRVIGKKEKIKYVLNGSKPAYVDIPIWHIHNIKNLGEETLITTFWTNEFYDEKKPDTYYQKV